MALLVIPVLFEAVPAGHREHTDLPDSARNLPVPQGEHADSPPLAVNVPARHGLQLCPDRKFPAGQLLHVLLLVAPSAALNDPRLQLVQSLSETNPVPVPYFPALHRLHSDWPVLCWYFPGSHV